MRSAAQNPWLRAIAVVAFHLVLAAGVLGCNPFAGQTVGPLDLLVSKPGWNVPYKPMAVRNNERTDVVDAMLPRWIQSRAELRQGRFPLWNPLPGGGEPGIHNLASAQLSPAFALFTAAPTAASGFYLATLFNLTAAGVGAYLWLRRRNIRFAACLGSVTITLCGFHAAWLFWPHVSTSVWICWLWWAVDRWWERPATDRFLWLVASTVLLILGGFPFVALLGLGGAGLLVALLWRMEPSADDLRRLAGFGLAMVIALALCAIPLWALFDWLGQVDVSTRAGGSPFRLFPDAGLLLPHLARQAPRVESHMYVGTVALVLAVKGLAIMLVRRRWTIAVVFPALLLLVSVILVFQLVPVQALSWVPGLGGNRWSRAIVLLDIALAALAASGATWLLSHLRARWLLYTVAPLVLLVHVGDLAEAFRRFNGPVPSAYFYPVTPLIKQIQDDLRPFDYTIADRNYLVAGTLGGYGIAEWYGHGFKSPEIKELLAEAVANPFVTPTASMIASEDVRLSSPVLRALGVSHVLGDETLLSSQVTPAYDGPKATRVPLPALRGSKWTQDIRLDHPLLLTDVELHMATYGRSGLEGQVVLAVDSANGDALATSSLPAATLVDGEMARFHFEPALPLSAGGYRLYLRHEGAAPQDNITVWYHAGSTTNCTLEIVPAQPPGCLIMRMLSNRTDIGDWRLAGRDGPLVLLENPQAPRGPYFLRSLHDYPGADASRAITVDGAGDHWTLRYSADLPGYVVLPMSSPPGWRFSVAGKTLKPRRYLGALPAIAVEGATDIEVRYLPRAWRYGKWISLLAMFALLATSIWLARGRPFARGGGRVLS